MLLCFQGKGEVLTYWLTGEDKMCRLKRISKSEQGNNDFQWVNYSNNNYHSSTPSDYTTNTPKVEPLSYSECVNNDLRKNGIVPSRTRASSLKTKSICDTSSPIISSKRVDFCDNDFGSIDAADTVDKSYELSPLITPSQKLSPQYEHAPLTVNIIDEQ